MTNRAKAFCAAVDRIDCDFIGDSGENCEKKQANGQIFMVSNEVIRL